jgi:hypothetical protein
MPVGLCAVSDCERMEALKRGWCEKHYLRWYRNGDPVKPKRVGRAISAAASYFAVHMWLNAHFPRIGRCEFCARTNRATEYASIGHTYTRQRSDWFELCKRCHKAFDGLTGPRARCRRGHPFDEANTYVRPNGSRVCRACARQKRSS